MMKPSYDVVIIGSGFGGFLLYIPSEAPEGGGD